MHALPVWWLNLNPDCHPRQTWDVQLLTGYLEQTVWPTPLPPPTHLHADSLAGGGAVVFINGGHHAGLVDEVNERLALLDWAVVLLTSDEGSTFPVARLCPPDRHRLWVMTPRPDRHYPDGTRFVGEGWPPNTPAGIPRGDRRSVDVAFAGQINHPRRQEMWAALEVYAGTVDAGTVDGVHTDGFARGLDRSEYLSRLAAARVVLAPGGPRTPDSFRAYEALEAGCVPILDECTSYDYPVGYWDLVTPGCPAPRIAEWDDLPKHLEAVLSEWPYRAADCAAWWQHRKRWEALTLAADVAEVAG